VEKFRDCARHAGYEDGTAARFQEIVMNLEDVEEVGEMSGLL
jgi:hypothetical protein